MSSVQGSSALSTARLQPARPVLTAPQWKPGRPIDTRNLVVVSVLLAEALILIWRFPYLPMTDLPEHMLAAQVLIHHDAPQYGRFFTAHFPWNPYSSYFLFVLATHSLLSVETATRLYLSAAFVLTLISLWWWIRDAAPGQDVQIIPCSMLLFGHFFYTGLINFLFSGPFFFLSLGLSRQLIQGDRRRKALTLALSFCLLAAYLSHIVTFALCCLVVFAQALLAFDIRRCRRLLLPIAPTICLLVAYAITQAGTDVPSFKLSWDKLSERLAPLLWPFNIYHDWLLNEWVFDGQAIASWMLVFLLIIAGLRLGKTRSVLRLRVPSKRTAWHTLVILMAGVVLLPSTLAGLGIGLRAAYFAAFVAIGLLPTDWSHQRTTRYLMILICAACPLLLAARMAVFTSEMHDLETVIQAIPDGQVIQSVITNPHSEAFHTFPFQHAAAWYSYYKGGTSPYLFATWAKHFPIRSNGPSVLKAPGEWKMDQFRYDTHQVGTDYFLVRTHDQPILADLRQHVPLAASAGEWMVFGPNPR